ncbi:MAG: hypothetical protein LBT87_00875 [Treponema sp.]|jgi:hypothetical protein|nr:hypothetical protein [Treponema sp.]
MSVKAALCLLISILLFAGFTVLAYTDLFDLIETRFYNPSLTRASGRKIGETAKAVGIFLSEIQARFAASLEEEAVRNSFTLNQRAEDIFERGRIYGTLLESQSGLQAVRFVDSGGSRIHFSSSPQDILREDPNSIAYRAYNEEGGDLPFSELEVPSQGGPKIVFDQAAERLVFSFPFYDSLDVYRGSALFYLSVRAVSHRLIREGLIKIGEDVSVVAKPGGFVLGLPPGQKQVLVPLIASVWNDGILNPAHLVSEETSASLALISAKTGDIFTGLLLDESLFVISPAMKIILLVSFFLTVYLALFLFLNLRQDPVAVVENRLKKLRIALLEHYYDAPEEAERNHWGRELELRREEIRSALKRGLKAKGGDLDARIDRAWDEFLSIIKGRRTGRGADEKKLEEILERILQTLSVLAPNAAGSGPGPVPVPSPAAEKPGSVPEPSAGPEEFEDLEELEELEEPEEPGRAAGSRAEGAAAAEPLNETPAAAQGIAAGAASPAETGELEEPEELDELEELDEVEELEELEEEAADGGAVDPPPTAPAPEEALAEAAPEEADELEEEPAELEELEEEPAGEGPAEPPPMTGARINEIASEIEFADSPGEEDTDDAVTMNLDIASPFDLMSFDSDGEADGDEPPAGPDQGESGADAPSFSVNTEDEKKNSPQPRDDEGDEELEELAVVSETGLEELDSREGLPYIYRPFCLTEFQNIAVLKALPDDAPASTAQAPGNQDSAAGTRLIEEREGLPYISGNAFKADGNMEQTLNREFKDLVDSVLGGRAGSARGPGPF